MSGKMYVRAAEVLAMFLFAADLCGSEAGLSGQIADLEHIKNEEGQNP